MRNNRIFRPQPGTLFHPETVLFVYNRQTERGKDDCLFNQRMCPDHDLDLTARDSRQYLIPLLLFRRAGQEGYFYIHVFQKAHDCRIMLSRQNLRRRHHTSLTMVINRQQHREQSHQSLPASHISLQKAVHLPSASHIGTNLTDNAFLRIRQLERQIFFIKRIKIISNGRKDNPFQLQLAQVGRTKNVKLDEKQLVKLQAQLGFP